MPRELVPSSQERRRKVDMRQLLAVMDRMEGSARIFWPDAEYAECIGLVAAASADSHQTRVKAWAPMASQDVAVAVRLLLADEEQFLSWFAAEANTLRAMSFPRTVWLRRSFWHAASSPAISRVVCC